MKHITIRIDDEVDETISQLMKDHKVTRSEVIRRILYSGINHISFEEKYLEKTYNLSVQNWSFLKILLEELISKEKFQEARKIADTLLKENRVR